MSFIDLVDGKHLVCDRYNDFKECNPLHGSMPKWIWNIGLDKLSKEQIRYQLEGFKNIDLYAGVMIVQWGIDGYMGDEYMQYYKYACKVSKEIGLKIILWDENGFPSGYAGGLLKEKYPQYTAKCLQMYKYDSTLDIYSSDILDNGMLMSAIIYDEKQHIRKDITDLIKNEEDIECNKHSKILLFILEEASPRSVGLTASKKVNFVDYLDSRAVDAFISLTHEEYYKHLSQYSGDVITLAFYDEPAFYKIDEARIWTPLYNEKFDDKFGFSPESLYPALFMDIGEETAYARRILLDFRAQLYTDEYVGTMAKWCENHGIRLTGHMDQEEINNPTPLCGDLMKVFEHQHIPGVDEIAKYQRGSRAYKIVSSSAYNHDKQLVMCEVFGAMGEDMPIDVLYKESMDLFSKGINFMVPHGTWYDNDPKNIIFPPELSFRSKKYGKEIREYNEYVMRAGSVLQQGRHCSDIGILYPISDLQAHYKFTEDDQYLGGITPSYTDYMEIGEILSLSVRKDYTFLHPETILNKCSINDGYLNLNNIINFESYKIVVIPSIEYISNDVLTVLGEFCNNGGVLIFTNKFPSKTIEFDKSTHPIIDFLQESAKDKKEYYNYRNGRIYILDQVNHASFTDVFNNISQELAFIFDVYIDAPTKLRNGNLSYIHKVLPEGKQVYYISNSSDDDLNVDIKLRGSYDLEIWNPHDSMKQSLDITKLTDTDENVMSFNLHLQSISSLILMEK